MLSFRQLTTNAETHPIKKHAYVYSEGLIHRSAPRTREQLTVSELVASTSVGIKPWGGPRGLKQDLLISNHKVQLPLSLNGPVS